MENAKTRPKSGWDIITLNPIERCINSGKEWAARIEAWKHGIDVQAAYRALCYQEYYRAIGEPRHKRGKNQ